MRSADPSLSAAERIDAACDRFEAELKAGGRPRIEDFLAAVPEADRKELQQALRAIQAELSGANKASPADKASKLTSQDKAAVANTLGPAADSVKPPAAIGRFTIRSVLGCGAFGKVYRAIDPQLGREVALKVPLETSVKTDAERAQFLKEARAAATINHPNICQIHEVGEHQGRPYIVMALVPGTSLADAIKGRKEPLPQKQVAIIIRKIAQALSAAHDKGIVHRDLKPANIMFDKERKDIIVMDFGLARGPRVADAGATQSGIVMGTPAYMSPEQARGARKEVGPAADVFSLGVIMYELLSGQRPFAGDAMQVMCQIVMDEPPPPSKHRAKLDRRLEAICQKAMAKDPKARYASMKELAAALDAYLRSPALASPSAETAKAEQQGVDTMADIFAALSAERKQARAEAAAAVEAAVARHRTPRWVLIVAGLFGLLVVGGLIALAGIVFFTRTDKVKVTLELTDVDLSDKTLSFFLDEEPISAEALAAPIELKPGEHVLVVKRGKEIVKRLLFTVSGGRNPGIKVKDITPSSAPSSSEEQKSSPEQPASDRDAAEWVLGLGGQIRIKKDGQERSVTAAKDLPQGMMELLEVDLKGVRKSELNDGLGKLAGLKSLRKLTLSDSSANEQGIGMLSNLPALKELTMHGVKVTDAAMKAIGRLDSLEALAMFGVGITDDGLANLKGLVNLRYLSIRHNKKVRRPGLAHLAPLRRLQSLDLGGVKIDDDSLAELKPLVRLKFLSLLGTPHLTGSGLVHLRELPELNELWIGDGSQEGKGACTDEGLRAVAELKQIHALTIGDMQSKRLSGAVVKSVAELTQLNRLGLGVPALTDDSLAALSGLDKLTALSINSEHVTDAGLKHLAPLWRLQELGLDGSAITGSGFKDLAFGQLRSLTMSDTPFKDENVVHLTKFQQLTHLDMTRTKITNKGLTTLRELKSLGAFEVDGAPVTNAGLLELKKALPECNIVPEPKPVVNDAERAAAVQVLKAGGKIGIRVGEKYIDVSDAAKFPAEPFVVTHVEVDGLKDGDAWLALVKKNFQDIEVISFVQTGATNAGMEHLRGLTKLRDVNCEANAIDDRGFAALADLKNLTAVWAHLTQLGDDGARVLAGLPELRYIRASFTRIDDDGLLALKKAPKLENLDMVGPDVTDAGLAHLRDYPALKSINLGASSKITDAGLAHLQKVKTLDGVSLDGLGITDAGLVHLAKCTQLKRISLVKTKVTPQGLADLRKALPGCEILPKADK
jgi:Leucine-rich repeat (LRR) protein